MLIQRRMAFVQSVILSLFSLMIVYLILTKTIDLYISPKVVWLAKLSAILLIMISIAKLLSVGNKRVHVHSHSCCNHNHGCLAGHHSHPSGIRGILQLAIFIVPLLLGFAMQPRILASTALSNSINTAGPAPFYALNASRLNTLRSIVLQPREATIAGKIEDSAPVISFLPNPDNSGAQRTDLMQLYLSIDDHPEQVYNQRWRLTGFVYKDPKLAKNQFVITRFVITCCIVDATPLGIIVESPDAPKLKADTWVEVTGILQKQVIGGSNEIDSVKNFHETKDGVPYLVGASCEIIPIPRDPYLAPPMQ